MVLRHLAGAEALDIHLGGHFGNLGIQLLRQLALGDGDFEDAAQAFIQFFNDLHRSVTLCRFGP